MKIFTALLALLKGEASAPKTLDAARATLTDARNCLDKIGAMFAAAALDLDAMLASGENGLKTHLAELNLKVTAAETRATEAAGKVTTAEAATLEAKNQVTALNSQLSALNSLLASIGFKPEAVKGKDGAAPTAEESAVAMQAAFKSHVSGAVTQQLQEIGQPAKNLPAADAQGGGAETEAELITALETARTPAEKGRIGVKLNALRDAKWAGKN